MGIYNVAQTTLEVWSAIRKDHPEMIVFSSHSAPHGDSYTDRGRMFTSYGFKHGDYPVIEAETTWEVDPLQPHVRQGETHRFWLCLPLEGD
jgi:hypothetical protein